MRSTLKCYKKKRSYSRGLLFTALNQVPLLLLLVAIRRHSRYSLNWPTCFIILLTRFLWGVWVFLFVAGRRISDYVEKRKLLLWENYRSMELIKGKIRRKNLFFLALPNKKKKSAKKQNWKKGKFVLRQNLNGINNIFFHIS